jgi:hypothetical protein
MASPQQPLGHIAAHPAQANHPYFHDEFLQSDNGLKTNPEC